MACAGTARGSADQSAARPSAKPKERKRDKYRHEPNRLFPSGVHLTAPTTTLKYFRATTSKYLRAQLHPAKAALPIGAEPTKSAQRFSFVRWRVNLVSPTTRCTCFSGLPDEAALA